MAIRGPQVTLDPEIIALTKDPRELDPPLLHWGLVIDWCVLEKLISERSLPFGDGLPIIHQFERRFFVEQAVMEYLEDKCKFYIRLQIPLVATGDRWLIELDDTRRLRYTRMKPASWEKRARPALKILRR